MICVGVLVLALILMANMRFSAVSFLQPLTYFFHSHCTERIPLNAFSAPELKAIVCGENFNLASTSQIYMASGLIHLFVVSGAHLILLEKILLTSLLNRSQLSKFLLLLMLFIYCLACNMNPPIMRSFISILFSLLLRRNHLFWTENFKLLIVELLTLIVCPDWLNSFGLQLSCIAALVVSMNSLYFSKEGLLFKQSLFFIFLWPLLLFFQLPSPVVIIANLVLTPVLEFFLFPLGLITWFFPILTCVYDRIILALKTSLENFEFTMAYGDQLPIDRMILWGWVLILGLHFILHFTEMRLRRSNHV